MKFGNCQQSCSHLVMKSSPAENEASSRAKKTLRAPECALSLGLLKSPRPSHKFSFLQHKKKEVTAAQKRSTFIEHLLCAWKHIQYF